VQYSEFICYLGICCYEDGELEKAFLFMNEALEAAVKNDEMDFMGRTLIWRGRIAEKLPDEPKTDAEKDIMEGLEILTKLKSKPDFSIGHLFLAELYSGRNKLDQALTHLTEADRLFEAMSMNYWRKESKKMRSHPRSGG